MANIALFSPGAMGASIGAAAVNRGHTVYWSPKNRSSESFRRADRAQLIACDNEAEIFACTDIILSVCPPHLADAVADQAIRNTFSGLFLEGNAISPERTRTIAKKLSKLSINVVDGGIIGGPAWQSESNTKLYLSGPEAKSIQDLFSGSPLHTSILDDQLGSASALKMVFAAYSKGTTALLASILAVANKQGVLNYLEDQWGEKFTQQTIQRVTTNAAKAWRFSGEMREISSTFENSGQPDGFHIAAAETFDRLKGFKDQATPELTELLTLLNKKPNEI